MFMYIFLPLTSINNIMYISGKQEDYFMAVMKNYMEDIVEDNLDMVIKKSGGCSCSKCRMDIEAIALNNLPTKYIVTNKGQLYAKISALQQQFEVDVVSAIASAIVQVRKSPRHTQEDLEDMERLNK
jgi:competence protein ComFB